MAESVPPEAYSSYAGGVNAAAENYRELREDELAHLVNGTIASGWVETRPKFSQMTLFFPRPEDEYAFTRGRFQGVKYYGFTNGAFFVYAVEGRLLLHDPLTGRVQAAAVAGSAPFCDQPFSKFADAVFMEQRGRYLVCQDGINPPVILDGPSARIADRSNQEVPGGTVMADGWGRLALVGPGRRRIYFSDHEVDPTTTPLRFTDGATYLFNAPYFEVPASVGRVVAMEFMPFADTATGLGPLVVFGERGTVTYDVGIPRANWATSDISKLVLPNIGASSPWGTVARNGDLFFIDHQGRIRTVRSAIAESGAINSMLIDRKVFPYYKDEDPYLRRWRYAMQYGNRLYVSIQPTVYPIPDGEGRRNGVHCRGLVVLNLDPPYPHQDRGGFVWEGLWTGLQPAGMASGLFSSDPDSAGREVAVIISRDPDGISRAYTIDEHAAYDTAPSQTQGLAPKAVETIVIPRYFDFGSPLLTKRLDYSSIRLSNIRGHTKVVGRWQPDTMPDDVTWFTHYESASLCGKFEGDPCNFWAALPQSKRRLNLPRLSDDAINPDESSKASVFMRARPIFRITGHARLEEMVFNATFPTANPPQQNLDCVPQPSDVRVGCPPNLWSYTAFSAPDAQPSDATPEPF